MQASNKQSPPLKSTTPHSTYDRDRPTNEKVVFYMHGKQVNQESNME